jgi:hypothetical protein
MKPSMSSSFTADVVKKTRKFILQTIFHSHFDYDESEEEEYQPVDADININDEYVLKSNHKCGQ